MINQSVTAKNDALGQPVSLRGADMQTALSFKPAAALLERAARYSETSRGPALRLVPAELVGSYIVTLPKSTAKQRNVLITYAVEDRIAAPIETVAVVQGPLKPATPGAVLAFVIARNVLAEFDTVDAPLLPEFLMIPRPDADLEACWSVWREGDRVVVRCSDGSGFAATMEMFAIMWARGGNPALQTLGAPLGEDLPAQDLSPAPPPPDPADMAFSFARTREPGTSGIGLWRGAIITVAAALVLQLGLSALNTMGLRRIAGAEREKAQLAIAERLPGVSVEGNITPILARLSPKAPGVAKGIFLPLLNDVTAALANADIAVSFRRLAWGAEENNLVALVQGEGLEELQKVQQTLETSGFAVRSGAANAGDGGAEVEMRISRGTEQ